MIRSNGTILVSGMIAGVPYQGGATWAVLQYILGLARLGHEVYFVEPITDAAIQPSGANLENSRNAAYWFDVVRAFGLEHRSALVRSGTRETIGLSYDAVRAVAKRADVLVNISGMLPADDLLEPIPIRVYLDLDPAFNQLWHATQGIDMRFIGHTHFVTVGMALGLPDCPVPTCDLKWIPTPQPVVLEHWDVAETVRYNALTTIANWRGYGSIQANGVFYGQKAHSLRQFMDLPMRTSECFLLALAIHSGENQDLAALRANGWQLLDPAQVAGTPAQYHEFIRGSKAEFGIAKQGYVTAHSGWFSDRSVCYLASGRPVLAQETGFSRFFATGTGLFSFQTIEDVLAAIDELTRDYARHARAARALACEYFDSDRVLTRILAAVGANA